MKRMTALIVAMFPVVVLAACGSGGSSDSTDGPTTQPASAGAGAGAYATPPGGTTASGGNEASGEIHWVHDFEEAKRTAAETGRPIFVKWTATWCGPCKIMDRETFAEATIAERLSENYICAKIDADENASLARSLRIRALPTVQVFNADGDELDRSVGLMMPEQMHEWLGGVDTSSQG